VRQVQQACRDRKASQDRRAESDPRAASDRSDPQDLGVDPLDPQDKSDLPELRAQQADLESPVPRERLGRQDSEVRPVSLDSLDRLVR
jgi:hypothetical protein